MHLGDPMIHTDPLYPFLLSFFLKLRHSTQTLKSKLFISFFRSIILRRHFHSLLWRSEV
ncbi:hypothetical protein HanRHA438_Chr10g0431361 [Helianthus annuus]|nr:hypothetical protein HanRHA438_Chr10g0431361 [Helianthus annuus]